MTSATIKHFPRMFGLTSEHSIITDAAVRRFQCQRAYLRAHAGLRCVNARHSVLRGQKPNASHIPALQQVDGTLRNVRQLALHHSNPGLEVSTIKLVTAADRQQRSSLRSQIPTSRARSVTRMPPRASGSPKTPRSLRSSNSSCANEHRNLSYPRTTRLRQGYRIQAFSLMTLHNSGSIPISYLDTSSFQHAFQRRLFKTPHDGFRHSSI